MYKILEHRNEERKRIIQLSVEYVKKLENDIGPFTSILYGSYARGDFNIGSDIDILIISDNLPSNMLKRLEILYRHVEGGIEPKGYTQSEFLKMISSSNPLALDALKMAKCFLMTVFGEKYRKIIKTIFLFLVFHKNLFVVA